MSRIRDTYTFRTEDLIEFSLSIAAYFLVWEIVEEHRPDITEDDDSVRPSPFKYEGSEESNRAAVEHVMERLRELRRRKDGSFYSPRDRHKFTDSTPDSTVEVP